MKDKKLYSHKVDNRNDIRNDFPLCSLRHLHEAVLTYQQHTCGELGDSKCWVENKEGEMTCRYGFGRNPKEGRPTNCFTGVHDDYVIKENRVHTPRRYKDRRVLGYEPKILTIAGCHIV